jgi:hypothetical protein
MTLQRISKLLLPIFIGILPFAFPLQVVTGNPLLGGIPYAVLGLHFLLFAFLNHQKYQILQWQWTRPDKAVLLLMGSFSAHLAYCLLLKEMPSGEMMRIFLVYICSGWLYIYISRFADEKEIRMILSAVVLASILMAGHWMYDTYIKTVLYDTNWYQLKMYEYFKLRNNFDDADVNTSLLCGPQSECRAYGLLDKHTTTGAFIALGGLSALALMWKKSFMKKFLVFFLYFIILSVGGATTAWIGFVISASLALLISERKHFIKNLVRLMIQLAAATLLLIWILPLSNYTRKICEQALITLHTQFTYVVNINGTSAPVSFVHLYWNDIVNYIEYLKNYPVVAFVGEGFWGHAHFYPRGGDLAVTEWLATLGIPVSCYVLFTLICVVKKMLGTLFSSSSRAFSPSLWYISYSVTVLLFLGFTVAHYNTLSNKAIFVFFYLSLGLATRHIVHLKKNAAHD